MWRAALVISSVCVLGCSSTGAGTDGGGDAGASGTDGGVPIFHRPQGESCPLTRDAGVCAMGDGACDAGANGRCELVGCGAVMQTCTYDQCFQDSDCDAGVPCWCRSLNDANVCVTGSGCHVDADCGPGGYCSPSRMSTVGTSQWEFHCHTAQDRCVNDSDCADAGTAAFCGFAPSSGFWTCETPLLCP